MRAEDDNTLGEWLRALGPVGIVGVRLTARPSGDGMLKLIKHFDVHLIRRSEFSHYVTHPMLLVVVVGELEDRLFDVLTQPNHRATNELIVPVNAVDKPRCLHLR